jgi:hypothetical protein
MPNNLVVSGNLTINGTATYVNTESISSKDPLFEVANTNNTTDAVDIGYYGRYYDSVQERVEFTGLFRDASDAGKFKIFTGLVDEPTNVVNTTGTGYTVATLVANVDGNLNGTANAANILSTARTIAASGDATWSVSFNGSANVSSALTLANTGVTATTYGTSTAVPTIAVDSKGRITSASNTNITFPVTTVNGFAGTVVLTTSDVAEGTNQYFTTARAQAAITGGASSVVTANLTASRALVSDGSGKIAASATTTTTEIGYLAGVTSAIQTQLNGKLNLTGGTLTGGLIGTTGSFSSSGSGDTFTIGHTSGSGIALNITKGGNGEGLYINKTSGSGNAATIVGNLGGTTASFSGLLSGTSATFSSSVTSTGNGTTTALISNNNGSGAQYYQDFGTGGGFIAGRILRGNGASGYEANGLNIDSFQGLQIKVNALGGSGGTFAVIGGAATFSSSVTAGGVNTFTSGGFSSNSFPLNASLSSNASAASVAPVARFSNNGGGFVTKIMLSDNNRGDAFITHVAGSAFVPSSRWLGFGVDAVDQMIINASGNVGIGTTSPGALLDISSGSTNEILRFGASSRWGFYRTNNDNRYISFVRTANATATAVWTVDGDNGNVGIGTSSPTFKLQVAGSCRIQDTLSLENGDSGQAIFTNNSTAVSVSTTTALGGSFSMGGNGAFVIVYGASGGNIFIDTIISANSGTPIVLSSTTVSGSPSARTYSTGSNRLQLSMASGTYDVRINIFRQT